MLKGGQTSNCRASTCCKFDLKLEVCSVSGVGNIYGIKKVLKSLEGRVIGQG